MWGWRATKGRVGRAAGEFFERLEPPAGCCSRGVYRHVSADASTLSRTKLGLATLVRCVEWSMGRRREHPPEPNSELLLAVGKGQKEGMWVSTEWKGLRAKDTLTQATPTR